MLILVFVAASVFNDGDDLHSVHVPDPDRTIESACSHSQPIIDVDSGLLHLRSVGNTCLKKDFSLSDIIDND
jgi:hypothetical protein